MAETLYPHSLAAFWQRRPPQRIIVVGPSGSGKSTLATRLGRLLDCQSTDIDDLFWQPNWQGRGDPELREALSAAVAGERWVLAGNYSRTQDISWPRAELVIWLDFSLPRVFARVVRRCLSRSWRREMICNGNYESLRMTFFSRESLLLWVLNSHKRMHERYLARLGDPTAPPILWLKSPAQVRRLEEQIWLLERGQSQRDGKSSGI
ncbi:MAG: adenylate kinase [Candidatus Sericytochromatia bacterium]